MANLAAAVSGSSLNGRDVGKSRSVCKIIILIETISNVYSHAQPQSRSTAGIRRGRRTWQFYGGGEGIEPNATCGHASGPGTGAALPGGPGGAFRQAGFSSAR